MKDTAISYDLVHQPQQHQSWNQARQQQHQTHTTSVYTNQSTQSNASSAQSQRGAFGHQQQQQQPQHAAAQLGQYHQQLQSTAHHNSAAAAAYYHQAHLYPTYQAHSHSHDQQQPQQQQHQQQHPTTDHQHGQPQHHLHHQGAGLTTTCTTSSVVNAAVAVAAQQHPIHHQQAATNTQSTALSHAGWTAGAGSLASQAHHGVGADHSTLAYMTHAYPSHSTSVSDHHRNSNGPMSNQPIGTGPQASSYAVDNLYSTPAAAVAAYGYNNYNTAFFQTSNNGPHNQPGHAPPAGLSAFWSHNQAAQQRTAHSQELSNQNSLQQRQTIGSDQAPNYIHDPRLYYGRPTYGQGLQNFSQAQHNSQSGPQDVLHRMTALSQQQLLQQHEQHLHQVVNQQIHHQSSLSGGQHQTSNQGQQNLLIQQHQTQPGQTLSTNHVTVNPTHTQTRQSPTTKPPPQSLQSSDIKLDKQISQPQKKLDYELIQNSAAQKSESQSLVDKEVCASNLQGSQVANNVLKESVQANQTAPSSVSPVNKTITPNSANKIDSSSQRKVQANNISQARNQYRGQHDERGKPQSVEVPKRSNNPDSRTTPGNPEPSPPSRQVDSDLPPSIEEGVASLAINSSRKTTWASIASQPAKVSQPKSLKSKIAGSNSVLSSAKHLAAVSLDSSSLELKNGINPAIKSSVSAATTSIQRSSIPPPVSKVPTVAASLKLDLLGEKNVETSRISWPAVNASVNLTLDEPIKKEVSSNNSQISAGHDHEERLKKDDVYRSREPKDAYKDHNHNQGSNVKMVNSYRPPSSRDSWNRREPRDNRNRRDMERKEQNIDKSFEPSDEAREPINSRRDYKSNSRTNNFRGDELYRNRDYNKRGAIPDRHDSRNNEGYQPSRFSLNRHESREPQYNQNNQSLHSNRQPDNQSTQHHHYNNVRDGNATATNSPSKIDLNLHPHLNPANFNPKTFDLEPANARYFIIKSYSEDDIHRSIKYSIWCSTNHGNKRLDEAYRQQQSVNGPIYLFFSVNGSGHFCGIAQMMSSVDFDSSSGVWAQSKWQGEFSVKWLYVKDVPNAALRHITLENNEDKPVTNSRDTQEVPSEKGKAVLKILHQYSHTTSLFDDFLHYERRQEESKLKKSHPDHTPNRPDERERGSNSGSARFGRPYVNARPHDFQGYRDRPSRFVS